MPPTGSWDTRKACEALAVSKTVLDSVKLASAGNRTRAARVAGEHSTTEPPMHVQHPFSWPFYGRDARQGILKVLQHIHFHYEAFVSL